MTASDTKNRPAGTTADELPTIEQDQELLKVGRTFSYFLVRSGQLPGYRVGRLLRIRRRDVEHWLESNR